MRLKSFIIFLVGFVLLVMPFSVFAHGASGEDEVSDSTQVDVVAEVNSFELFWPIVAGKTMGDTLYPLKTLKERVRGWFIFGRLQKADYAVFLATKRVVEAEKLMKEDKKDLANKTLNKSSSQLKKAQSSIDQLLSDNKTITDDISSMTDRLSNLELFIPWLALKYEENKEIFDQPYDRVESLNEKL